jgi:hypothetical protein
MDNFWPNETEIDDDVFYQLVDIQTSNVDMVPD